MLSKEKKSQQIIILQLDLRKNIIIHNLKKIKIVNPNLKVKLKNENHFCF